MRSMPFHVAVSSVVTTLSRIEDENPVAIDARPTSWDYLTPIHVRARFDVDLEQFSAETGLPHSVCSDSLAVLQLDCASTGWRELTAVPLGEGSTVWVDCIAPLGAVAVQLDARAMVLLGTDLPLPRARSAYRKGSKLYTGADAHLVLEGSGSTFPVDAFDFAQVGLPSSSPWHLSITADDLDAPFLRVVRLSVNTTHPSHRMLLQGNDPLLHPVLMHDLVVQMLVAVAPAVEDGGAPGLEAGSLGGVLESLCQLHLGTSLVAAVEQFRSEPAEFFTVVKGRMGFLEGVGK